VGPYLDVGPALVGSHFGGPAFVGTYIDWVPPR
jgi:hypothetical protein